MCNAILIKFSGSEYVSGENNIQGQQKRCGWCGICHTTFFVRMQRHTTLQVCIQATPHPKAHLPINYLGHHELWYCTMCGFCLTKLSLTFMWALKCTYCFDVFLELQAEEGLGKRYGRRDQLSWNKVACTGQSAVRGSSTIKIGNCQFLLWMIYIL